MGGREINVAYDGTFGDLSSTGDAQLFDLANAGNMDFDLDGFIGVNSFANGATVSPKDLFSNDSVPPSTSFTNLTTPGSTVLETPDDYQTSPLFDDAMGADNPSWFSLFPEEPDTKAGAIKMERTSSNQILVHPGGELNRKRSSTSAVSPITTPLSPVVKHSTVAGVSARRRDKPLPPIIVSEDDPVALKRARNTAAARKSRAKKVAERDGFEAQIVELQTEVEYWKARALAAEGVTSE